MTSHTIDTALRRRIVHFRKVRGYSYRVIARELTADGQRVSHSAVQYWCQTYEEKGEQYVYSYARPQMAKGVKVTDNIRKSVDEHMEENPETSSLELQRSLLEKTGTALSTSRIRQVRNELGWRYKKTRYCQLIRDANKTKRLEWCQLQMRNNEKFDDVIFTDEATFEAQKTATKMYYKKGRAPPLRPKPKHPLKVSSYCFLSNVYAQPIKTVMSFV